MPEFKHRDSYLKFAGKTKYQNRYIFDTESKEYFEAVLEASKLRTWNVPKNHLFWRARIGNSWREIKRSNKVDKIACPLPENEMKPLPNMPSEGRINPKGISYLYLATDKETAMSEVRPWLRSFITVAELKTIRDLKLIDCSVSYGKEPFLLQGDDEVWRDIDRAFSIPLDNNDTITEYVPTQVLAELLRNNGFDGIKYKSSLADGHNVVLFDINAVKIISRYLYEAKSISFSFFKWK